VFHERDCSLRDDFNPFNRQPDSCRRRKVGQPRRTPSCTRTFAGASARAGWFDLTCESELEASVYLDGMRSHVSEHLQQHVTIAHKLPLRAAHRRRAGRGPRLCECVRALPVKAPERGQPMSARTAVSHSLTRR
jgi:hypothetical protein